MKDKSNVTIIHSTCNLGGGSKSLLDIVRMLSEDYCITVCIPKGNSGLYKLIEAVGGKVKFLNSKIPIYPRYSGGASVFSSTYIKSIISRSPKRIKLFVDEVMQTKPDVLVFNSSITALTSKFFPNGLSKICFVRETIVHHGAIKRFKNVFSKYFSKVYFLAENEAGKFALSPNIVEIIPDAVPTIDVPCLQRDVECEKNGLDKNKHILLFMGGEAQIKGLDIALDAFSMLDSSYQLVICGSINLNKLKIKNIIKKFYSVNYLMHYLRLRKAYKKIKHRSNIIIKGYITDISSIMCASDVILFPSRYVHQPRPCIEAGFFGKTAILSNYYETSEYFTDNVNCLTFDPNNAKDLSKKIASLFSDIEKKRNLEIMNEKYSREKHDFIIAQKKLHKSLLEVIENN